MNPAVWKDKVVLVTGHTGFKGSWMCLWLQRLGAKVIGFSLAPPTTPSLFEAARVSSNIVSIEGDIGDLAALQAVLKTHRPEVVFHMAAQPLVRASYQSPVETYATNVMGTVHVLEAIRLTDCVRAAVVITTDKCYENREWVWGYRENEPMGGHDPYSSSKGCAELVTSAYRNSFFPAMDYPQHRVGLASVRAGNVIGGGDWASDRLIPDIMKAIQAGNPVLIRNPNAIRPWQHVLEPISGYLSLAERLWSDAEAAEGWNFGPNDEDAKSVGWIVNHLTQMWGNGASWILDEGPHPHEAHYLKLDCSKAKAKLGWVPQLNLPTALDWIVEFYQGYFNGADARSLVEAQIERYQAKITSQLSPISPDRDLTAV